MREREAVTGGGRAAKGSPNAHATAGGVKASRETAEALADLDDSAKDVVGLDISVSLSKAEVADVKHRLTRLHHPLHPTIC